MARYRKVDPRMWGDAKFRALSQDGQRVWFYLLTGPEVTNGLRSGAASRS
jgi:hypothetical protein